MDPALIITSACDCPEVGNWDYGWLDMNDEYGTGRLEVQYVKRYRSVLEQFSQIKSYAPFLTGTVRLIQLIHSSELTKMDITLSL